MSRLARSHKDWHHLQEVCAVFDALLADEDGAYDLADPNDRLLLGLLSSASYPTPIPHARDARRYPGGPPPFRRRRLRHREGLLLEGGYPVARPATPRRP